MAAIARAKHGECACEESELHGHGVGMGAHLASIRRLYASCARRLPTPRLRQSMLRMGRAHAEPEPHVRNYSRAHVDTQYLFKWSDHIELAPDLRWFCAV